MQHGHFTSLQLDAMNHWMVQSVHTNALHGSSSGWHTIIMHMGHRSCSRIALLLELASKYSSSVNPLVGGATARMPAIILFGLRLAGRPQDGNALGGCFGWQI